MRNIRRSIGADMLVKSWSRSGTTAGCHLAMRSAATTAETGAVSQYGAASKRMTTAAPPAAGIQRHLFTFRSELVTIHRRNQGRER